MHLRYSLFDAPAGHAQKVMRELGITYSHSTPQPIGEQWWFWNCEGVPDPLPPYLTHLGMQPEDAIGLGLSKEMAEAIRQG